MKKNYKKIPKEIFDIIPTKRDLILLYENTLNNSKTTSDNLTLISLTIYIKLLGHNSNGKND